MKTRPQLILLLAILVPALSQLGCTKRTPPSADTSAGGQSPSKSAELVSTADDEAATTLESAGLKTARATNGRVVTVDATGSELTDSLAKTIASLSELTKLIVRQSTCSDEGWKGLSQLAKLQHFDLRDCPINNHQLASAISGMPKLRSLRLSGKSGATTVDDEGLKALAHCPALVLLAADDLWISEVGLQQIAAPEKMKELYLARTLVEDAAMTDIAKMTNLKKLRLANTGVSNEGLKTISDLGLEDLDISECLQIDNNGLISVGQMTSLLRLNLWRDAITDEGIQHLASLVNLQWLNLDNTQLSDSGLPALKTMKECTFMHLGSTGVTDSGMLQLEGLKKLKDLKVTRTAVTEVGAQQLTDAIPGLNVQLKYIEGQ